MDWFWIMNGCLNAAFLEFLANSIAIFRIYHEQVINAFGFWRILWNFDIRAGEQIAIKTGSRLTFRGPVIEMLHLNVQHCSLKTIHSIVVAHILVKVTRTFAVATQLAHQIGNLVIVRSQRATFTICTKVFPGIETECRSMLESADAFATVFCAVSLTGIFDHQQAMPRRNLGNLLQIG